MALTIPTVQAYFAVFAPLLFGGGDPSATDPS